VLHSDNNFDPFQRRLSDISVTESARGHGMHAPHESEVEPESIKKGRSAERCGLEI
jgi:hypothetical protein